MVSGSGKHVFGDATVGAWVTVVDEGVVKKPSAAVLLDSEDVVGGVIIARFAGLRSDVTYVNAWGVRGAQGVGDTTYQ